VADEAQVPDGGRTLSTSRMEAFSDGVIAIAITLLVLEVAVRPPGSPLEQFLRGWPSYLAYVVSFATIGAAWMSHHALTERLVRADPILLRLNLLFLLLVAFLPFPTRLVADSLAQGTQAERVAAVVYGVTLLAIRVAFFGMDVYSRREHLVASSAGDTDLQETRRKFRYAIVAYGLAIAAAFLVPLAAIVFYLGIALFLLLSVRAIAHVLRRRAPEPPAP
jgi:uncharacterized membrane protein